MLASWAISRQLTLGCSRSSVFYFSMLESRGVVAADGSRGSWVLGSWDPRDTSTFQTLQTYKVGKDITSLDTYVYTHLYFRNVWKVDVSLGPQDV